MTRHPVPGVIWQTMAYLVGLARLGHDVYYIEAHGGNPSMFCRGGDDGSPGACRFLDGVMRRFDLPNRWALHGLHSDGAFYGLSKQQCHDLYRSADLLINLHGAMVPRPEHAATGRLIYLESDPGVLQIELFYNKQETIEYLEPHTTFFTFGENLGNSDCGLPLDARFDFKPTRQPAVMEFWEGYGTSPVNAFTTIGNWKQEWREIDFKGETYHWSKHFEFLKVLDLPARARHTNAQFEMALSRVMEDERRMLEEHGWQVRDALAFGEDLDTYRDYVASSRGEFTVAKDQNIRLKSGWFSDRAVTYLASGRPVITQETGFSNVLPCGEGLLPFSTLDDAVAAVESVQANYARHRRAASRVARECFSYDVVLPRLLEDVGL